MHTHPNARLTPIGRERLIRQHLDEGRSLAQLAADNGISERTARKWLARFRSGGPSALADRRSVRRSQRRTLDPQQLQQAVDLRHQRCTLRLIARVLLVPISTLARTTRRLGLNRLRNLDPKPPVQRYQETSRGTDSISTSNSCPVTSESATGGTGERRQGCSLRAGDKKVYVAVDDVTRLSYVEALPHEKGPTTVWFLSHAVDWFNGQVIESRRVLSDNGSAYKSDGWRKACQALELKVKKTRPCTPRTNAKAEQFIKTLPEEGAYVMPYTGSTARNALLPAGLRTNNGRRGHMALGGITPQQRLDQL